MRFSEIFQAEGLPVFQNKMFSNQADALACPQGDLRLVQDMETGLIFNSAFNPDLLQYDDDYQNEQACSSIFKNHLYDVKELIQKHFTGKSLIEVGCGKGYFLEYLSQSGFEVTGIDPAYEGTNPSVIKAHFVASLGISADGVILRHVLEHVPEPLGFLSAIVSANGGKGRLYIEVPCFDWICNHRAWFDIFYEHVNYFRLEDLNNMFDRVYESGHVFGGQYLYIVADMASLKTPHLNLDRPFELPVEFMSSINKLSLAAQNKRNAIWGGASKGLIFSLYMKRLGIDIDCVIDINPAKQNKFMATTGLQVFSPDKGMKRLLPGDNVFVMNSNYFDEIVEMSNSQYNYIKVDHYEL